MSMSTDVVGIVPPDAKWRAMRDALDACRAAGVAIPDEIDEFFGLSDECLDEPDPAGRQVDLSDIATEWNDGRCSQGLEIDVAKLIATHPNVKVIRFRNSF